ncbi:MAG: peptidyl-prolyl cis-trans isomerase [Pseudomonadota bacterium]
MLQQIRGALRNSKFLTAILAVLVIAAFAFVGVFDQVSFGGGAPLKVGDETFSAEEIERSYRRRLQIVINENAGALEETDELRRGVFAQTVSQLAVTATVDEDADDLGLAATGDMVRNYLKDELGISNPITGQLDRDTLSEIIARNRMTVEEFYEIVEGDIVRQQITTAVGAPVPAPQSLASTLARRRGERRLVNYAVFGPELATAVPEPTEEDLMARYERDKAALYSTPERRRVAAVILDTATLAGGETVDDETLRTIYEANAENYRTPETRSSRRITAPSEAAAQSAVAALRAGETTFEVLAEAYGRPADAIVFADQTRDAITDAAVAKAVFEAEAGEILDPVSGLFGYVVVQVDAVTPESVVPFEEARAGIREAILADRNREALYAALEKIETERDTGAGLREAAITAEIDLIEPAPFDRAGETARDGPVDLPLALIQEAFRLAEGEETAFRPLPEGAGDGEYAMLVQEIVEAEPLPFEEVREQVLNAERAARIEQDLRRIAGDASARYQETEDFAGAAAPAGVEAEIRLADLNTVDDVFTRSLLNRVFNAEVGEPFVASVGDRVVLAVVSGLTEPGSNIPADQLGRVQDLLGAALTGELAEAYLAQAQAEIGVTRNPAKLQAIVEQGR